LQAWLQLPRQERFCETCSPPSVAPCTAYCCDACEPRLNERFPTSVINHIARGINSLS
jgi:hypothetical protein